MPAIHPVEGGSINAAYRLTTKDNGLWFCKINDKDALPDLLEKERRGLDLLREQEIFRIPAVVACDSLADKQVLILEWIGQGPKTDAFWRLFGEQLARLHRVTGVHPGNDIPIDIPIQKDPIAGQAGYQAALTAGLKSTGTGSINTVTEPGILNNTVHGSGNAGIGAINSAGSEINSADNAINANTSFFGLDHDNYMGSLPQQNTQSPVWTNFFIRCRLEPQVRLAVEKGLLETSALRHFERLYQALPAIFPEEAPSLLHGDLWSGNFLCDENSRPVLIDPAVYFGHRSMDLAMTTLFGGFEKSFYESYAYHFPFPANYRELWEICNLYPLLIHLNLFGESYRRKILYTIQRF